MARIFFHQLEESVFRAPLRHQNFDAAARRLEMRGALAEDFFQKFAIFKIHRNVDRAREVGGVQVKLLQQRGQKFGGLEFVQVFPIKVAPVHDAPPANVKQIDGHQRRLGMPGQDVDIVPRGGGNFLALLDLRERSQKIAVGGRLFETFGTGGLEHARLQTFHQVRTAALQKHFRVARGLRVFFIRGESRNAGPVAPADVILQARPRVSARQVHRARGDAKRLVDEMDDPVRKTGGEIGTKVNRAVFRKAPGDVHARIFLERRVTDVRIRLVVAKQDVELRFVLLDQIVFEGQGFALVVHDDVIDVRDFAYQRASLRVEPPRLQEVRLDAVPQGARFAHVENISQRVLEQVDAGVGRQSRGFL